MFIFSLQNALVLFNTYLISKNFFPLRNPADRILSFLILSYAQIILILTFLGKANLLYLKYVVILEVIISLFLILLSKKRNISIFKERGLAWADNFVKGGLNKIEVFGLSAILGFALVKIAINLINPPFGWDCLNYHFTFPVEWLKHGNLINPIVVSDYPAPTYYPLNGSLIFLWLIMPFKSVILADLGQLPFFIMSFLAVYAIAQKIGINKHNALFSAVLFTITPNYFKQLEIAYVDVMVAGLFLAGLNFLLLFCSDFDIKSLILLAISMGGLIGTKIITLPYAFIVFMLFICILLSRYKILSKKRIALFIACFIVLVTLLGGFSYIRNCRLTGNMFYPLNINIFDRLLLKGVMEKCFPGGQTNFALSKLLFHEGLGLGFLVFVLPGMIFALLGVLRNREFRPQVVILFTLIPLLYLVYHFVIGLANVRYLYPWIGICYCIGIFGFQRQKVPTKIINCLFVIVIIASIAEIAGHLELVSSLFLTTVIFFIFMRVLKFLVRIIHNPLKTISLAVVFLIALNFISVDYLDHEYSRYELSQDYSGFWPDAIAAWTWLNDNTSNHKIAYVGRPVPFPLYGTHFKNDVFYVSVNKNPPIFHAYKDAWYGCFEDFSDFHKDLRKPGNYRGNANFIFWMQNLFNRKTDYLFIYSLHQTETKEFPIEDGWAVSLPQVFRPAFINDGIHIYKIAK